MKCHTAGGVAGLELTTETESEITDKIEAAVNTISGIDELRSTSVEGVSQVYITFLLDKEIDVAAQEVRDKVSAALPDLPEGVDPPTVVTVIVGRSTPADGHEARPRCRARPHALALVDQGCPRGDRVRGQDPSP